MNKTFNNKHRTRQVKLYLKHKKYKPVKHVRWIRLQSWYIKDDSDMIIMNW